MPTNNNMIATSTAYKAAGIIPYAKDANFPHLMILLGLERRGKQTAWSEFGGKREKCDAGDTKHTAAREFCEETKFALLGLDDCKQRLQQGIFVPQGAYMLYTMSMPMLDLQEVQLRLQQDPSEKLQVRWMSMPDLLRDLRANPHLYHRFFRVLFHNAREQLMHASNEMHKQ